MNAAGSVPRKNSSFPFRALFAPSISRQRNLVFFLILPVLFVSFLGSVKTLHDASRILRSLKSKNFLTADLEGFHSTLGFITDLSHQRGRPPLENLSRERGYLIHARALLRDARTHNRYLSLSGQKTLEALLRKIDQVLKATPRQPDVFLSNDDMAYLRRQSVPVLLELSRSTNKTLQLAQKSNRRLISLQFTGFVLILALTGLVLAWLERYRRFLRNFAIYEALNVSVSGIAFLPVSMDRFLVVNKGFEELSGFRAGEICQKSNPPIDPFFGRPDLPDAIGNILQGNQRSLGFTTEIPARNGRRIPVYVRLELTEFEGERQIVATIDDRTDQNRLQQDLESSRNHLEKLVRHLGEGVMEIDPDGKVLSLNSTGERLLGFRSEDLSGSSAEGLFRETPSGSGHTDRENSFIASRIRGTAFSNEPYETENCSLIKKDGSLLECSLLCTPIYQSSGGPLKEMVLIFRDIGSRKRLQKKLQKNEEKYRKMIQNSPDGILLIHPDSFLVLETNPAFADMAGIHFTELLLGNTVTAFLPDEAGHLSEVVRSLRSTGTSDSFSSFLRRQDRGSVPVSIRAILLPYEEEESLLLIVRDTTFQSHSEAVRRILHQLDQRILENLPIEGVFSALVKDLMESFSLGIATIVKREPGGQFSILALSSALADPPGMVQKTLDTLVNENTFSSAAARVLSTGERQILDTETYPDPYKTFFRKNHIEASAFFPVSLPGAPPLASIGISVFNRIALDNMLLSLVEDLSDKLAIAFLHENEQRQIRLQQIATEAVDTPIFIAGPGGTFEWANKAYLESKGCTFEEIPDFSGYYFSRISDRTFVGNPLWEKIRSGETYIQEYTSPRKDGGTYPVEIRISPIFGDNRELLHMVCIETNLTDIKLEEEDLRKKAYFDPLTHLANRHMMEGELSRSIEIARRNNRSMAVLFLDLDGFKEVNDNYGHEFGDKLLVTVAGRLEGLIRSGDLVARLGGDEFVIILNNIRHTGEVLAAAGRILVGIQAPYFIDGQPIIIGTSIGIAIYPEDDKDASSLLRDADQAMYLAKNRGKNNFVLYTASSYEDLDRRVHSDRAEKPLPSFQEDELGLSPIRSLSSGKITGFSLLSSRAESLAFNEQDTGRITPYAEKKRFFEYVRHTWEAVNHTYPGAFLKISLPAHQAMEADFYSVFHLIFGSLAPEERNRFLIGLHGHIPFPNTFGQENSISKLAGEGFSIGTERVGDQGNTLFQLRHLPVQFLEVSRALVREMAHEANDLAVLGSIFLLGKSLDKKLIVPAVDDVETAMILKRLGFDWCSGMACGEEVPVDDPGRTSSRDAGWKRFSEDFHAHWNPENISYLLGRRMHREAMGALSRTEKIGEEIPTPVPRKPFALQCPIRFWLNLKSTADILGVLNVSQWKDLEEKFHRLADDPGSLPPATAEKGPLRVETMAGVVAEMQRFQTLAENVLFGSVIPEKL